MGSFSLALAGSMAPADGRPLARSWLICCRLSVFF
nr:MAG TPA: hypothetical protein [Caudoviricetes sp.]